MQESLAGKGSVATAQPALPKFPVSACLCFVSDSYLISVSRCGLSEVGSSPSVWHVGTGRPDSQLRTDSAVVSAYSTFIVKWLPGTSVSTCSAGQGMRHFCLDTTSPDE